MRCEVVAVGTELLLGQIVDTNSSWIGEQLATAGIDSYFQTKVGDNHARMRAAFSDALARAEAVVVTGGLGPTQDDITRDVIADLMGVDLVRNDEIVERIRAMFGRYGRSMPDNNLRQADVPDGASPIPVQPGTAAGLVCPFQWNGEDRVIYAVPGVPWEMHRMMLEYVLPDMRERAGISAVIRSRTLRTWGASESGLAEMLADEIDRIDREGGATIAFNASGIEGLKVRLTAKADTEDEVDAILDDGERRVRATIGDTLVFGLDDETMEHAVLELCRARGETLGMAESLTGGLIASRITSIPGASEVFLGSIVSYASTAKAELLAVPAGTLDVSEAAAEAMVRGAASALGSSCAIAVTGVAGPEPWQGVEVGTVMISTMAGGEIRTNTMHWPFDRDRIRQFTVINALNQLRLQLLEQTGG